MIQGLIVTAVLAVVCMVLLPLFEKGIRQEMSNVAIAEIDETFLEMATLLRRQDSCLVALGSPSSVNSQNLTIHYSLPTPTVQGPIYLKSGDSKGRITINNIEIGVNAPSAPIGPPNAAGQVGRLGFFRITARATSLGSMDIIRVFPIYMLTNPAGTSLSSCFITKFSKTDSTTGKQYTIEDQACQTVPPGFNSGATLNPNAVYDPANKTCI